MSNNQKVKASFKCEKETLDSFRRLVAQKYGKLYGVLETEFAQALNDRTKVLRKETEIPA